MKLRILIGDDHKIVREGLYALLEKQSDIEVVGEADNGLATVQMAKELSPDVVVMDVCMPDLNGIEATRRINDMNRNIRILALSMYSDKRFVLSMMKAGAAGYLVKDCASNELIQAIRAVSSGRTYLCAGIGDVLIKDYISQLREDECSVLTAREREVLQLLAEGKTTREIALKLHISVKTVETHRYDIMNKLDIHTVAGLTKYALRDGLTPL